MSRVGTPPRLWRDVSGIVWPSLYSPRLHSIAGDRITAVSILDLDPDLLSISGERDEEEGGLQREAHVRDRDLEP